VREQEGVEFFNKVEQLRKLAIEIREDLKPESSRQLKNIIQSLTLEEAYKIARAFSIYFQLVNIAEERQRIRRIEAYDKDETSSLDMSLRKVFHDLHEKNIPHQTILEFLSHMDIELVLTAHPTEAKRRSVLDHLLHIASDLTELGNEDLAGFTREKYGRRIKATLEILWQTSEIRQRRVEVIDEIDQTLFYFQRTILNLSKEFYEKLEREFQHFYGDKKLPFHPFMHFGSWVGADRDGNANVTCEITQSAAEDQKELILKTYLDALQGFIRIFSQSVSLAKVSTKFLDSIKQDARLMPRLAKTM
jgi:phosphoenolpyruvate carboxylase